MKILQADRTDAQAITELTFRSKDHWNYGAEQIEKWRDDLTITPDYVDTNHIYKLMDNGKMAGFYAYQAEDKKVVKLNFLFIDPDYIGKGYGKKLTDDFLSRVKNSNFESVILDADPHAEAFYKYMGFKVIGQLQSSIKDRFLPIMEMKL